MVDLNAVREALVEALDSGPVGIECNCEGDGCTGTCTRAKVKQAIYEIDQLPEFCFAVRDPSTKLVHMKTYRAANLMEAINAAYTDFSAWTNIEGFRCWPVAE